MPIKKLPDSIIARIAAGEVITSQYNIIKELLENSLDAGATSITVNISSTLRSLSVRDNGPGIKREDLEYLCLNHYTSKISSIEDLKRCGAIKALGSFGFRGEALHSISLCSHLKVTTKRDSSVENGSHVDGMGYLATYNSQNLLEIREVAYEGYGTLVEVGDIFYTNCIRAEHFFKNKSELSSCIDLLKSYGCIFAGIEGKIDNKSAVERDDSTKNILDCADDTALNNRIEYIIRNFIDGRGMGEHTPGSGMENKNRAMVFTKKTLKYVIIATGPQISLKSFKFILFVNSRLVRNGSLRTKVLQKYKSIRGHGKGSNPLVFIEVFLEYVDVNVHPSKSEVLVGEDGIFDSILKDIEDSLLNQESSVHPGSDVTDKLQNELANAFSSESELSAICREAASAQSNITGDTGSGLRHVGTDGVHNKSSILVGTDRVCCKPDDTADRRSAGLISEIKTSSCGTVYPRNCSFASNSAPQTPNWNPYKIYSLPTLRTLEEAVILSKPKPKRFSLVSLRELCQEIVEVDSHFFRNLSFVGSFTRSPSTDPRSAENFQDKNGNACGYIFAQHQVDLVKIEREGFLLNAFYQKVVRDFGNFECREIGKPIKVDIDEDLWDLLKEYFGLHISDGYIIGAPAIYDMVCEDFSKIKACKSTEKETLRAISQEIARCYSSCSGLSVNSKLFNRIKVEIIGTRELFGCCALMTDLKELYKGFDRC